MLRYHWRKCLDIPAKLEALQPGRGTFTMEPLSYEKVPEEIAERVIL